MKVIPYAGIRPQNISTVIIPSWQTWGIRNKTELQAQQLLILSRVVTHSGEQLPHNPPTKMIFLPSLTLVWQLLKGILWCWCTSVNTVKQNSEVRPCHLPAITFCIYSMLHKSWKMSNRDKHAVCRLSQLSHGKNITWYDTGGSCPKTKILCSLILAVVNHTISCFTWQKGEKGICHDRH